MILTINEKLISIKELAYFIRTVMYKKSIVLRFLITLIKTNSNFSITILN